MKRLTPLRRSFSNQPARYATASPSSGPLQPPGPSPSRGLAPPPPSLPPAPSSSASASSSSSSAGPSSYARPPPVPAPVPEAVELPRASFNPQAAGADAAADAGETTAFAQLSLTDPGRPAPLASSQGRGGPSVPLTGLPSFLVPFLPTGASLSSTPSSEPFTLYGSIASMFPAPAVLELPPQPSQAELRTLSLLQGLLPLSSWRHHPLIVRYYLDLPSALLTDYLHQKVGYKLCRGPNNFDAHQRLSAVVRRMKADGVEVPRLIAEKLLRTAVSRKSQINTVSGPDLRVTVDRLRERSKADADKLTAAWDVLYKETAPADDAAVTAAEALEAQAAQRSNMLAEPAPTPEELGLDENEPLFRSPHAPPPEPVLKPSRRAFESLLRLPHTPQTFSHLLAQSPAAASAHLPSILSHLHRSYSSVPDHLPEILKDPELRLSTHAINEILFAFTSDPNIHLNVPFEAYVAFRRHAAGLPWRRTYIARAAQGMYHNFDDALVSFANPILDSMNYDFPATAAPNRKTYQTLLRAAIFRGDLTLALSVFRDMIDPNGMSLRLPGSAPGRAGRPPKELEVWPPVVEDYTQFWTGFIRYGEVYVVSDEARDYWKAHPTAFQRAGGGDVGEAFEDASTREHLWKTWQAGMGVEVAEMEDPYLPGFGGEMPSAKQYAVNAATENKRWTLQTLIILFRSFLNLKTGSAYEPRRQATPSYMPPRPPVPFRLAAQAPSSRRMLQLLKAIHHCAAGHPLIIRSAWEACEDKFGKGNDEGWVDWKVKGDLAHYLGTMGIKPRPFEKGHGHGGYEYFES